MLILLLLSIPASAVAFFLLFLQVMAKIRARRDPQRSVTLACLMLGYAVLGLCYLIVVVSGV
ncbi:hypothetical protein [Paenibacillus daejeonensis]|uniref:hypothetical protein n=1 Tax=Paenibacillus daejeonensis TaxID=135193 RepID=UPI00037C7090|nr:hypothetical protein [Paenibacillus daejeonensis]